MHVPASTEKVFFRQTPHPILHTSSTSSSINVHPIVDRPTNPTAHVPMAMDVSTNGYEFDAKHVECSASTKQFRLGSGKPRQKLNPTRRGRGGRGKNQGNQLKTQYFSILGTNANGLKAKKQSLFNTVNFFNKPSVVTIQEK